MLGGNGRHRILNVLQSRVRRVIVIQSILVGKSMKLRRNLIIKKCLTALPLDVAIIVIGALMFGLESVGAGLMFGGVGVIVYGVGGFWRFTEDWMKFTMSLVALIIVIWLAYYWNKRMFGYKKGKDK